MNLSESPLTNSELRAIAPVGLHSHRPGRYQGQDERVPLAVFAPVDQVAIRHMYGELLSLFETLKPYHDRHSDCRDALLAYLETPRFPALVSSVSSLGHATAQLKSEGETGRLVHDLRGGAMQALVCRLDLLSIDPDGTCGLQNVYFLVRDHLKIMRNCVVDLDPVRLEADSLPRDHDVDLLIEKWSDAQFQTGASAVEVKIECQFEGTLCESCLEFSSLDRIIYNLMNNAARHTSDGVVHFYVLPVPHATGENIRFIVANRVSEEHREILMQEFRDDPGELFRGGFTTGGNGFGTRICADFCAHAYGIFDFDAAKRGGYFGARWAGDYFVTWFHWPRADH